MRASETVAAILQRIEQFGDGEMQDCFGWPITHIAAIHGDDGRPIFNAESDEGCSCIDRPRAGVQFYKEG